MNIPLSPCVPGNLVSRDGFSRPVPRQPAHLHTQAESGGYLRDSCSRVLRRRPFMKPPYAIVSVPSLSGHANAYRWRFLLRVRWHRAINLKVVPNECCLGRSPWTLIHTPTNGNNERVLCCLPVFRKKSRIFSRVPTHPTTTIGK